MKIQFVPHDAEVLLSVCNVFRVTNHSFVTIYKCKKQQNLTQVLALMNKMIKCWQIRKKPKHFHLSLVSEWNKEDQSQFTWLKAGLHKSWIPCVQGCVMYCVLKLSKCVHWHHSFLSSHPPIYPFPCRHSVITHGPLQCLFTGHVFT